MKQKWIALAVLGAMLVQVAPISSMTAAALETTAISDITATDAVLLKYNKHDTYVEITGFRADETDFYFKFAYNFIVALLAEVKFIQPVVFFREIAPALGYFQYPDRRNCLSSVCRFAENRS